VTISFVGGEECDKAMEWLVERGIPAYNAPDLAVKAIANLHKQELISELNNNGSYTPGKVDAAKARQIIDQCSSKWP